MSNRSKNLRFFNFDLEGGCRAAPLSTLCASLLKAKRPLSPQVFIARCLIWHKDDYLNPYICTESRFYQHHVRVFLLFVHVFLLLSMYSYCSSMQSYCCLCILFVVYVFLLFVHVFLSLSMYSYCCLCILRHGYPD